MHCYQIIFNLHLFSFMEAANEKGSLQGIKTKIKTCLYLENLIMILTKSTAAHFIKCRMFYLKI